jgi:alanine dehydrogenase
MIVGVPKEVKSDEYRVGMLPVGAEMLVRDGHTVLIQESAGVGAGFEDELYAKAGAEIVSSAAEVYERSEMIVKVKEPQPAEIAMHREGQIIFTYFHFAADRELTTGCLDSKIVAVAYETLTAPGPAGRTTLPLLTPMSEVAGKMATQEGAKYLERPQGGLGILLGGVPGVKPANVLILGGGVVGTCAAKMAAGLGANVTIMDLDLERLRYLDDVMPKNTTMLFSDEHAIRAQLETADLVIGAVLIAGAKAPHLIRREHLKLMQPGSVIVDVAVDQGGCVETTHPTTHADPIFVVDDVIHYCVANMPGAVCRTSTQALCNATMPHAVKLANMGPWAYANVDPGVKQAINMDNGKLLNRPVAEAHGLQYDGE